MEFKKYQHIERYGNTEVQDIEMGKVYVFPKIDGTNASVWMGNDGTVKCGSRNRELSLEKDNAGFCKFVSEDERIKAYLTKHPTHRLYGEWLVPHSLKTYRDKAWRKFYVFDVCIDKEDGTVEYIPYDIYSEFLIEFELDYIAPLFTSSCADYEMFSKSLEQNTFLIKDNEGTGEGIVIKNYDFYNKYKRQTWAKIVTNEFKDRHKKAMGYNDLTKEVMVEQKILDDFCTNSFIEKEYAKILNDNNGEWTNKMISQLLGRVFSELIKEESWNIIKKYKNPTINYKTLNALVTGKIKKVKQDIF